jgi:hypothetical protein
MPGAGDTRQDGTDGHIEYDSDVLVLDLLNIAKQEHFKQPITESRTNYPANYFLSTRNKKRLRQFGVV